jgi:hypothetical protein
MRHGGVAVLAVQKNANVLLVRGAVHGPGHEQVRSKEGFILMVEDAIQIG